MRNSMDSGFNEIKDVKARRSIRDGSEEVNISGRPNRMKLNSNEDRSNSEPPRSYASYLPATSSRRLKPIREKNCDDAQGSSDEDGEFSKSNSQLNESDSDLEIPDSASASVSQAPTPTPLASSHARRINSETNLNDSKRRERLSGFMGNRSKRFCASTSELSFTSHLDTQKSLFSPKNNALSRQSFNSSLYGSNQSLSSTNSRLFMVNSPFYNGKTMFGGSSAYPRRDINQHKILRTPVQMRPSSSLSNSSNTSAKSGENIAPESNAAKRILEVMNTFSGPLKEARTMGNNINSIIKIPSLVQNRKRFGEDELILDRSIALSSPSQPYGRPLTNKRPESPLLNSSIIKPLQIPTMSQLLQMKRLQNNTERVREIANRSESFLNRNLEYKLPSGGETTTSSSSSSLKMKSNITKNLLRSDKMADAPALPLNLPNIQLPGLTSVPKFDIQLPKTKASSTEAKISSITQPPLVQFNSFQSSPTISVKAKPTSDFNFAKPTTVSDGDQSAYDVSETFVWAKPRSLNVNDNVEIATAKSSIKSSLASSATDSLFKNLVAQQKSSSWECDSCLTRNDSGNVKCLCCETAKPGLTVAASVPITVNAPSSDDLFKSLVAKQKSAQWTCIDCTATNDVNKDKCACCEAAKPGMKTAALTPSATFTFGMPAPKASDDLFKNLAASQKKSQWSCDDCMANNEPSLDKCACCGGAKPGSKVSAAPSNSIFGMSTSTPNDSAVKPAFSFGMPAANAKESTATKPTVFDQGFKKLVEKQSEFWECSTCMTRNEPAKKKCMCCEQDKPGSNPTAPSFSFGNALKSSVSLPAPSEVKFSFGVPQAAAESKKVEPVKPQQDEVDKPKPTFSFGGSSKLPEASVKPTPSFTFKAPAVATSTAAFTLNPPATIEKKVEDKPAEKPPTYTFGSVQEVKAPEPIKTAVEPAKTVEPQKSEHGGFKFSETTPSPAACAPAPAFGSSLNKNGGFSFGGFGAKPAESIKPVEPIKAAEPSAPGGFSFGAANNNSISFGQAAATTTAASAPSNNSFVFGSSRTETETPKTFGSFGATSNSTNANSPFGIPSVQSAPVFGQASTGGFSFPQKKEETPAAAPSLFSFGASKPATAPMLFGNQMNQTAPAATPMFGASSVPMFGANSNNNNKEEFGSKMPSFGNNHSHKRSFEVNAAHSEVPIKRIEFSQPQPQSNASPFSFNNAPQAEKPAFNFAAAASPNFNFTATAASNPQTPQSAPVIQFGAGAAAPQVAIPGLTFSAQGTSSAAANQRKILRASRRATTRR